MELYKNNIVSIRESKHFRCSCVNAATCEYLFVTLERVEEKVPI
jgi:hypothetical protein